jgi:hypothetical protein
MIFQGFFNHEKGVPRLLLKLEANGLQHVFNKWVERCKKCIACEGGYFVNYTVTVPLHSSESE